MTFPLPPKDTSLRTIAFDFDGTLAEGTWPYPALGPPIPLGLRAVEFYVRQGFEVVIYTARPASHREAILEWCERHHIREFVYDVICGKPRAALYIDDRAITFPEGLCGS